MSSNFHIKKQRYYILYSAETNDRSRDCEVERVQTNRIKQNIIILLNIRSIKSLYFLMYNGLDRLGSYY